MELRLVKSLSGHSIPRSIDARLRYWLLGSDVDGGVRVPPEPVFNYSAHPPVDAPSYHLPEWRRHRSNTVVLAHCLGRHHGRNTQGRRRVHDSARDIDHVKGDRAVVQELEEARSTDFKLKTVRSYFVLFI